MDLRCMEEINYDFVEENNKNKKKELNLKCVEKIDHDIIKEYEESERLKYPVQNDKEENFFSFSEEDIENYRKECKNKRIEEYNRKRMRLWTKDDFALKISIEKMSKKN